MIKVRFYLLTISPTGISYVIFGFGEIHRYLAVFWYQDFARLCLYPTNSAFVVAEFAFAP